MRLKIAASSAALLLVTSSAGISLAEKGRKSAKETEVPATFKQQFQWEEKVVGPKAGLDKDRLAAIQEQGRREEEQRKKEPPKKQVRAEGVDAPATAALPTMDIEKPAAAPAKKQKKVASDAPRQRDALDNLLDEQGVKPNRPPSGGDGLGSLFASSDDDRSGSTQGRAKKAKKTRR
jgi:hypothetical protein